MRLQIGVVVLSASLCVIGCTSRNQAQAPTKAQADRLAFDGMGYFVYPDGGGFQEIPVGFEYGHLTKATKEKTPNMLERLTTYTVRGRISFVDCTSDSPREVFCSFGQSGLRFEKLSIQDQIGSGMSTGQQFLRFDATCIEDKKYLLSGVVQKQSVTHFPSAPSPNSWLGGRNPVEGWQGESLYLRVDKLEHIDGRSVKKEVGRLNNIALSSHAFTH